MSTEPSPALSTSAILRDPIAALASDLPPAPTPASVTVIGSAAAGGGGGGGGAAAGELGLSEFLGAHSLLQFQEALLGLGAVGVEDLVRPPTPPPPLPSFHQRLCF